MASRGRHPKKEVADALKRAEVAGLLIKEIHKGHRWGEVTCGRCDASRAIFSTPQSPGNHAKQIDRFTTKHRHQALE
jgi:hypothetical protein